MKNFLAKINYQIICGNGNHTAQFDEQLRLISAMKEEDALEKANLLGIQEQDSFINEQRRLVQWKFINVSELYEVDSSDGAEVWSCITEQDSAELFIEGIKRKSAALRLRYDENFLPCF
ncbi:MAG: DUF4288 domain-containing protein [Chitinophagales bacterium]